MTWTKTSPAFVLLLLLLQGCGIYSFSGTSLSSEVKTFSLDYQSNVALGPPELLDDFQKQLSEELLQRTSLKQVATQGDLRLEGVIKQFKYAPLAPSKVDGKDQASKERLTIEIQMNYHNPHDKESSFSKRNFSQYADMPADGEKDTEEPGLIKQIFTKLIKDIFNATVAIW